MRDFARTQDQHFPLRFEDILSFSIARLQRDPRFLKDYSPPLSKGVWALIEN